MNATDADMRLEALQLACNAAGSGEGFRSTAEILARAKAFADFVIGGIVPGRGCAGD